MPGTRISDLMSALDLTQHNDELWKSNNQRSRLRDLSALAFFRMPHIVSFVGAVRILVYLLMRNAYCKHKMNGRVTDAVVNILGDIQIRQTPAHPQWPPHVDPAVTG